MRITLRALIVLAALLGAPHSALGLTVDTSNRAAVVSFYNSVYLASSSVPSGFTGSVAACDPGTIAPAYQEAGRTRILYYRAMVGLDLDITLSPTWNTKCQAAALMMSANRQLSHNPPTSWVCYTATGAEAASKSNLAGGSSSLPAAIDLFMGDVGISSLGHRRWVLYPPEQTMGVGATFGNGYNAYALWVIGGTGSRPPNPEWIAWPSPGHFPYMLLPQAWSFSYPGASFAGTIVTMELDGVPLSLTSSTTPDGYGDNTFSWVPQGIPTGAPSIDRRVHVTVSRVNIGGVLRDFSYDVFIINPAAAVAVSAVSAAGNGPRLLANVPNPFVQGTMIRYTLSKQTRVRLRVYDIAGRLVSRFAEAEQTPGEYSTWWDGRTLAGDLAAAGVYLCRVESDDGEDTQRLLLTR
jgi:hypothetical protein